VDQVGEQRHRAGKCEDRDLDGGGRREQRQTRRDRLDAGAGAQDRAVDKAVAVAVRVVAVTSTVRVNVLGGVRMGMGRVVAQKTSSICSA
jgi:hypothetical protein